MEYSEMVVPICVMVFLVAMGMLICITLALVFFNDVFLGCDKCSRAELGAYPRTHMQVVRTRTRRGGRRSRNSSPCRVSREKQLMRLPNRIERPPRARKAEGYELPFTGSRHHSQGFNAGDYYSSSRGFDARDYPDVGWARDMNHDVPDEQVWEFRDHGILKCAGWIGKMDGLYVGMLVWD